ncbi:MAG: hypothetical protein LBI37_01505 [Puniceicoccales bacterium]|jgi:hypothetical protein|nr:hypothetical protein [Puniceicoccales bacterium]
MQANIDTVIQELGGLVGFSNLKKNEHGVVHLEIQTIGHLFIDVRDDSTFMYLLRSHRFPSSRLYMKALELCNPQAGYQFPVNPVLQDDDMLGFAIKHSCNNFTIGKLEDSIKLLTDLQDRLGGFDVA